MKLVIILTMVVGMVGAIERWTIADQVGFEKMLLKHGIEPQTAMGALTKNGIQELQFGPCERTKPDKAWAQIQAGESVAVDRIARISGEVFLSMPTRARVPHNVVVELDTHGEKMTDAQRLELRAAANKVHAIMREQFGLGHVVESHYKVGTCERIELIPGQKEAGSNLNLADKLDSIVRVVFRDGFAFYYAPISEEERLREIGSWSEALTNSDIQAIVPDSKVPERYREWQQVETNRLLGRDILLDRIHAVLDKEGIIVHREVVVGRDEKEKDTETPLSKTSCAFCNPKIKENQHVYKGTTSEALFNYCPAPGIPRAHYLIIPERHVSDITNVNADEALEMHRIADEVKSVVDEKFGKQDWVMYIQNGSAVGKTVDHVHIHLLPRSDTLAYLFFSLDYGNAEKWTSKRIQDAQKPIQEALLERLRPEVQEE